jgi:hypothetical protein
MQILCGINVNGARWPDLGPTHMSDGKLNVEVALVRTVSFIIYKPAIAACFFLRCQKVPFSL